MICLIESPYEKIGKFVLGFTSGRDLIASMKVPPKRKGNLIRNRCNMAICGASMEALPIRKGNLDYRTYQQACGALPQ